MHAPRHTSGTPPARPLPAHPPARSEVSIYIQVPQGVRAKQLDVSIKPQHLRVGIKELPPYLDVSRRPRQLRGGSGERALKCSTRSSEPLGGACGRRSASFATCARSGAMTLHA